MKRRLFNLAAALSLVLCVATALLWVRSYWVADIVRLQKTKPDRFRDDVLSSNRGQLGFVGSRLYAEPGGKLTMLLFEKDGLRWGTSAPQPPHSEPGTSIATAALGVDFAYNRNGDDLRYFMTAPHALIVLLTALAPAYIAIRFARRRRPDICAVCGYDLRVTPGRCPECGVVPEPPHNPTASKVLPRDVRAGIDPLNAAGAAAGTIDRQNGQGVIGPRMSR